MSAPGAGNDAQSMAARAAEARAASAAHPGAGSSAEAATGTAAKPAQSDGEPDPKRAKVDDYSWVEAKQLNPQRVSVELFSMLLGSCGEGLRTVILMADKRRGYAELETGGKAFEVCRAFNGITIWGEDIEMHCISKSKVQYSNADTIIDLTVDPAAPAVAAPLAAP